MPAPGRQANPNKLKKALTRETALAIQQAQVLPDSFIQRAGVAERAHQFRAAVDDLAIAASVTPSFAQRDTLTQRLREVVWRELGADAGASARVDSLVATALDQGFRAAYDNAIPVTRAAPPSNGRVVLAEYTTGIQCGICWVHDRAYAAVLQRYPSANFVLLAYHGGPGYPIVTDEDNLWGYIGNRSNHVGPSLYRGDASESGWIDGQEPSKPVHRRSTSTMGMMSPTLSSAQEEYREFIRAIDQAFQVPPQADIALGVTPRGVSDTGVAAIDVQVRVTLKHPAQHVGVRLVLVEDTVRVIGFTNRRQQYFPVRTVAWFGEHSGHGYLDLFAPLPAQSTAPATVTYRFDVAELQRSLLDKYRSDEDGHTAFPDVSAWQLHPRRMLVVAIVQDMETREVLQTAVQRVFPPTP